VQNKLEFLSLASLSVLVLCISLAYWVHWWVTKKKEVLWIHPLSLNYLQQCCSLLVTVVALVGGPSASAGNIYARNPVTGYYGPVCDDFFDIVAVSDCVIWIHYKEFYWTVISFNLFMFRNWCLLCTSTKIILIFSYF
jgi:hypothetical protein